MRALLARSALLAMLVAGPAHAQDVEGTGQQASAAFFLPAGLAVFELRHEGTGPFAARLLDETGALVEQLAQAAEGPFQGSRAVHIPRAGRYLYDVSATRDWAIRLRPAGGAAARTDGGADVETAGMYAGLLAARGRGTVPWLFTGLLGGALTGPLGAGANLALATSRPATIPADALALAEGHGPTYREAFLEAYRRRLRGDRRTAALVGGGTGTVIFTVLLWQLGDWGGAREGGNTRTPPSEVP